MLGSRFNPGELVRLIILLIVLGVGPVLAQDRLASINTSQRILDPFDSTEYPDDWWQEVILDQRLFGNFGEVAKGNVDHRRSWSINYGINYDESDRIDFLLLSYQTQYDYSKIWIHPAPEALKMRFEAALGAKLRGEAKVVASFGVFVQYYFKSFETDHIRPFVEGGIGVIYTDFKLAGQGLRVSFNPRASLGFDIKRGGKPPLFVAIRAHHVSNAGLTDPNIGINSVLLVVGKYF